ncbi:Uncharacterised protein [Bordetella pertussis]|nr:Uncharacterised protein [Bordetella pertussis]CFW43901.1 Uncharacterised protein [Bordetella pertussis]CPL71272.1 Uncharacterised protein [Bordetella pertussis]CPM47531.1 Uncharacterised protein [Bordetella pertussis]CPO41975.1 Uncharacterised protein [Bordetella pertussis]
MKGKLTYRHLRPVSSCVRTMGRRARFSLASASAFRRVERPALRSLMREVR